MRKLTYYIAVSQDGFVSRDDGTIDDFTFDGEHVQGILNEFPETIPTHLRSHFEVDAGNRRFDTVLMGRHTYELGQRLGISSPYQHLTQFLFSKSLNATPSAGINLVSQHALDTVRGLKQENGLDIWLCGGPQLATELIGEIDTIILKSNPFLIGSGKTLFASPLPRTQLTLTDRTDYASGFSLIQFDVQSSQPHTPVDHSRGAAGEN